MANAGTDGPFSGRVAVVTGAASGIGRAAAVALAGRGARVLAVDMDGPGLDRLARHCEGVAVEAADVCEPDAGRWLADRLPTPPANGPKRIDVLANVAGSYARAGLGATDTGLVERMFAVNVVAPTLLTQAALPYLEKLGGAVVNVSSTFGHRASATASCYAAAKAAVEHLTRCWALELAPRRIRVNAVAPGPTETRILARAGVPPETEREQRAAERRRVPLRRLGSADEVAAWILALAEPGSWVTGQVVSVDGGLTHAA